MTPGRPQRSRSSSKRACPAGTRQTSLHGSPGSRETASTDDSAVARIDNSRSGCYRARSVSKSDNTEVVVRRIVLLAVSFLLLAVPGARAWTWPAGGDVLGAFVFDSAHPYAAGQHRGIDIGAAPGEPILAPAAGSISFAGTVPGGGPTLTILTPDGYAVTLLHLGSLARRARGRGRGGPDGRSRRRRRLDLPRRQARLRPAGLPRPARVPAGPRRSRPRLSRRPHPRPRLHRHLCRSPAPEPAPVARSDSSTRPRRSAACGLRPAGPGVAGPGSCAAGRGAGRRSSRDGSRARPLADCGDPGGGPRSRAGAVRRTRSHPGARRPGAAFRGGSGCRPLAVRA